MPHITVEYSSNVFERPAPRPFLRRLHDTLIGCGPYKMEDIKSRLVMHDDFLVSSGETDQCFVHLQLAIMPRDPEIMKQTSAALMEVLKDVFSASLADKNCALSVEIRLLDKDTYVKASGGTL
jgi:5-carboxymethyl-2-hydroxymuconate isomerase